VPAATGSRATAFGLCAVGALVAGIGATLPWTIVGLQADEEGVLDETFHGIDLTAGLVVLVLSIAVLVMLFAMRLVAARRQRVLALGLLVAGLAILTATLLAGLSAGDRAVSEMAQVAANAGGLTIAEAEELIRTSPDFAVRSELGIGLWLAALGGVLVVVGSVANAAWARRTDGSVVETGP
jgi:hypothetical protein